MRARVAVVGHDALLGNSVGPLNLWGALGPTLERVLPMREGKAGIGTREGGIEAQGHLEELARLLVLGLVKAVHVPKAAVISLPSVEGIRRFQDGSVALNGLDLARDRGDDAVSDLVENEEGVVKRPVEALRPDDPRIAGLRQLDLHQQPLAVAPH